MIPINTGGVKRDEPRNTGCQHPCRDDPPVIDMGLLQACMDIIQSTTDIKLDYYDPHFLVKRLKSRMHNLGVEDIESYIGILESKDSEAGDFLETLTVAYTEFFRNAEIFSRVGRFIKNRASSRGGERFMVWSCPCATGEEPYSLAMFLQDMLDSDVDVAFNNFTIHASDISKKALTVARNGIYSRQSIKDLPPRFTASYLQEHEDGYSVDGAIKDTVTFFEEDLLHGHQANDTYDLIFCRNFLIYLKQSARNQFIDMLQHHLKEGGLLVLGKTEHVNRPMLHNMNGDWNMYIKHSKTSVQSRRKKTIESKEQQISFGGKTTPQGNTHESIQNVGANRSTRGKKAPNKKRMTNAKICMKRDPHEEEKSLLHQEIQASNQSSLRQSNLSKGKHVRGNDNQVVPKKPILHQKRYMDTKPMLNISRKETMKDEIQLALEFKEMKMKLSQIEQRDNAMEQRFQQMVTSFRREIQNLAEDQAKIVTRQRLIQRELQHLLDVINTGGIRFHDGSRVLKEGASSPIKPEGSKTSEIDSQFTQGYYNMDEGPVMEFDASMLRSLSRNQLVIPSEFKLFVGPGSKYQVARLIIPDISGEVVIFIKNVNSPSFAIIRSADIVESGIETSKSWIKASIDTCLDGLLNQDLSREGIDGRDLKSSRQQLAASLHVILFGKAHLLEERKNSEKNDSTILGLVKKEFSTFGVTKMKELVGGLSKRTIVIELATEEILVKKEWERAFRRYPLL
ncbi:hypothetical protein GF325_06865 [Candidatus Bathyarchaeota archaeon]|nr:hypothetical protein [Candidatus Bathyarchaeota archaeon]